MAENKESEEQVQDEKPVQAEQTNGKSKVEDEGVKNGEKEEKEKKEEVKEEKEDKKEDEDEESSDEEDLPPGRYSMHCGVSFW